MTPDEFAAKYLSIAQECSAKASGLDPRVILAQFADETGWGTSPLCLDHLNLAGISHFNGWANSGGFCSFPTLADFVVAYGQVINNGLYGAVLAAAKAGESADAQAKALGESDWAASHYDNGGGPGSSLVALMAELPSSGGSPVPSPTPAPASGTTTVDGRRAYIVQEGDNLSEIASRFNLTLAEIESWNPQFAPDYSLIHPGNVVYLEAASAPAPAPDPAPAPAPDYAALAGDLRAVAQTLLSVASALTNGSDSLTSAATTLQGIAGQL